MRAFARTIVRRGRNRSGSNVTIVAASSGRRAYPRRQTTTPPLDEPHWTQYRAETVLRCGYDVAPAWESNAGNRAAYCRSVKRELSQELGDRHSFYSNTT